MTHPIPLTAIETQLISRTRPYNDTTWTDSGRYLTLPDSSPQTEVEGAAALVKKGYLEVTYSAGNNDRWYELTCAGLAYFKAAWPNRKD